MGEYCFYWKRRDIMCGIIVNTSPEKVPQEHLDTLIKRGPDDYRKLQAHDIMFHFHRLSIMGLDEKGMQPFIYDQSVLVANAEIYNYTEIKKELEYKSEGGSDCEILLPLYQTLGVHMFDYLDGEFAIVLYDAKNDSLVAGRDPIGIRPLFYGYHNNTGDILFASEAKSLIGVVKRVYPFPPGTYYDNGEFIRYSRMLDVTSYYDHMFHDILERIRITFTNAVVKRLDSDAPMGFLLSGGLDSSMVCSIASRYLEQPIRTFSIGMITDPIDLKYAKQVAEYLGTIHTEVRITKDDVLRSLPEVVYALETYDITTIRASIGMYLLAQYIHERTDIKVLMTGEVSDELFGYKYTDFAPNPESFQQESIKRVKELYMYDVLRADRCLAAHSLEARVPFADIEFASYVLRVSPIFKMNKYKMGKYILRESFTGDYLPQDILYRDKAAFSDAVGHSLVDYLKEYAEHKYTDTEYHTKKLQYHPQPFSKEALLYRELFESYYPEHGHLIVDYWMPNKEWKGCNVQDPSARVLSNYGKSGE
jgi:asparagine synthase (glutamine-hydrolysing)